MDTIKIKSNSCKMVAHRGVSKLEKENTCPAFVAAGNRSYYGIETDVHLTKDNKIVVIHDETTERISDGANNINVEENDYSAVADIVLPDIDGSTHRQDIRIPLLKDYISICKKYEKKCVLEVKNEFPRDGIVQLLNEIKEMEYLENVIFISFSFENCVMLRELSPESEIQFLTHKEITDEMINSLVENKLDLDAYYKLLTKELVDELHSKGIVINCWTVDNPEKAAILVDMGVDFITSNILE